MTKMFEFLLEECVGTCFTKTDILTKVCEKLQSGDLTEEEGFEIIEELNSIPWSYIKEYFGEKVEDKDNVSRETSIFPGVTRIGVCTYRVVKWYTRGDDGLWYYKSLYHTSTDGIDEGTLYDMCITSEHGWIEE